MTKIIDRSREVIDAYSAFKTVVGQLSGSRSKHSDEEQAEINSAVSSRRVNLIRAIVNASDRPFPSRRERKGFQPLWTHRAGGQVFLLSVGPLQEAEKLASLDDLLPALVIQVVEDKPSAGTITPASAIPTLNAIKGRIESRVVTSVRVIREPESEPEVIREVRVIREPKDVQDQRTVHYRVGGKE